MFIPLGQELLPASSCLPATQMRCLVSRSTGTVDSKIVTNHSLGSVAYLALHPVEFTLFTTASTSCEAERTWFLWH